MSLPCLASLCCRAQGTHGTKCWSLVTKLSLSFLYLHSFHSLSVPQTKAVQLPYQTI